MNKDGIIGALEDILDDIQEKFNNGEYVSVPKVVHDLQDLTNKIEDGHYD